MIGQTIGHYRVLELLGKGGMGEVYKAEDTTLGREVAIKVLPQAFTEDPERLARFEREAKLLATLNHPHIAQIHSLEKADGQKLLVMELVDGQTLAEQISEGALPVEEALPIAIQITQALEAAHERGIIHRDLKPANIKITPDGEVKVLDFGLAKPITDSASSDLTHSPTLTYSPTQAGVMLGTAAYMSPEQARGQEVDRRTDIWSFGVVLWEMLTGRRFFDGDTVSDILAGVLKEEPRWDQLPADLPRPIGRLLHRCLTRDLRERLHDIADARLEIEEAMANPKHAELLISRVDEPVSLWHRWRTSWWFVLASILGGALAASLAWWSIELAHQPTRVSVRTEVSLREPTDAQFLRSPVAISPDGNWLVFTAYDSASMSLRLFRRSLSQFETTPFPGLESGSQPFFSPDGQWVGYWDEQDRYWKKVPLQGGSPVALAAAKNPLGATWGTNGDIVFHHLDSRGLWRIPEAGGDPVPILLPDFTKGITDFSHPEFLPGGTALLYTAERGGIAPASSDVGVLNLATGETKPLIEGAVSALYISTGHLLYGKGGFGYIAPFDLDRLEVTGPPIRVPDPLQVEMWFGGLPVAVSKNGTLVFFPATGELQSELVVVNLNGDQEVLPIEPRPYQYPQFSPNGKRIAVTVVELGKPGIWIIDPGTGLQTELPGGVAKNFPVWSSDGQWVAFAMETAEPPSTWSIYWQEPERDSPPEPLLLAQEPGERLWPYSVSITNNLLLYGRWPPSSEGGLSEIWFAPLAGDFERQLFADADMEMESAALSPDGNWIAYVNWGEGDLYVQSFPEGSERFQVSKESVERFIGWSPNGTRLYYIHDDSLKEISVSSANGFHAGTARELFRGGSWWNYPAWTMGIHHDVAPDGESLLMVRTDWSKTAQNSLFVVQNWFDEVERLTSAADN